MKTGGGGGGPPGRSAGRGAWGRGGRAQGQAPGARRPAAGAVGVGGYPARTLGRGSYLLVWKRWSGSVRWQEESWQPKSLMSRQPGSSLGQVPTPRGAPSSGKGSSGVRNFSYEVVADASSDMAGDGLARAPSLPRAAPLPPRQPVRCRRRRSLAG